MISINQEHFVLSANLLIQLLFSAAFSPAHNFVPRSGKIRKNFTHSHPVCVWASHTRKWPKTSEWWEIDLSRQMAAARDANGAVILGRLRVDPPHHSGRIILILFTQFHSLSWQNRISFQNLGSTVNDFFRLSFFFFLLTSSPLWPNSTKSHLTQHRLPISPVMRN